MWGDSPWPDGHRSDAAAERDPRNDVWRKSCWPAWIWWAEDARHSLNDLSEKITTEQKTTVQEAIQGLQETLKSGGGLAEITAKVEELKRLAQEMGASVYQQTESQKNQQQTSQQTPPPNVEKQGKKTVDAEYKVVDD